MTSTEVAARRAVSPWVGTAAIATLLVTGGLLPGYTGVLESPPPPFRGPDRTLIGDGAWPYLLALFLGLAGSVAMAALYRREPEWLAPAVLTLTAVPAFALTTELADPPSYYRPYSDALEFSVADRDGTFVSTRIDIGPGSWLTFVTLLGLAVGAVLWLGRSLDLLARPRYAGWLLVLLVIAAVVGYQVAEATAGDTCDTSPVDSTEVSPEWALWLVLYVPATLAGVGIGALTRRRIAGGLLLIAGGAVAFAALVVIGVEIASPCLD